MKKLLIFILLYGVAHSATFSELEKRVSELEQKLQKLSIKVLDREMAEESPLVGRTIDTSTSISDVSDTSLVEDEYEYEYIEIDPELFYNMQKKCIDFCTEQYNKSWNPKIEDAHKCMDDCMTL